jgi:hypothetical protein
LLELTRLKWEQQFKPFIYLNDARPDRDTVVPPGCDPRKEAGKEKSHLAAGPSCFRFVQIELAILVPLALLALLALLTARILLLLAGLLAATLLLLTGLLAGILIRLVLVGHQRSPLLDVSQ